ncbi:chemotaxis protein CheW [Myxosarcina sp. GI1]|uniref:chemotaxis protein CheW n=1 Tax=Myxosarcina sp. GI1 TaxID=1541065 RepID=UPI00055AF1AE|nr:chemotaxis protein CheW [Myxosarcina sp. GI1]
MESRPYLIFSLHGLPYAIDANCVREIFLLPELIPAIEAPNDIIGLLNLRSQITPIMHLDLRFGHRFEGCHSNDCVIVVESQGLQIGIVIHDVREAKYIEPQLIKTDLSYGRDRDINAAFVAGVAEIADEVVFLLDVDNLVRHRDRVVALIEDASETEAAESIEPKPAGNFYDLYFPQATAKESAIMRQRAENLRIVAEQTEDSELTSLAVVDIDGEYFGIDLDIVREFTKIGKITSIPQCPSHIVGNMNLRGEILTLIDLRQVLNLQSDRALQAGFANRHNQAAKAVAVNVDDEIAGILVDRVVDVTNCPAETIALPLALDSNSSKYFKGTTNYSGKPIGIIDISKMLSQ